MANRPDMQPPDNKAFYASLQERQNKYCLDIIVKLWSLLDGERDHEKIVSLIKEFDAILPKMFSDVVTDELVSKSREQRVRAIHKFSIFWKLTGDAYPQYVAFPDGCALFNMLDFLEDKDPTLRLSSKSWLSESTIYFRRILDPLVEFMLHPDTRVYVTPRGQMFFPLLYDTRPIISAFGKFRSIILNTQEELISYMKSNPVTNRVREMVKNVAHLRTGEADPKNYLVLVIQLTLKFIMGQAVETLNPNFYAENHSVNASACELLELLLKTIDANSSTSTEISHMIVRPVIHALSHALEN